GGDRVAESWSPFVVPSRRMGTNNGAGCSHQPMRPDGHQRIESEQRRRRAQDGQIRPLPLRLNAETFACFLKGGLDPPAGDKTTKDRGGRKIEYSATARVAGCI